MFQVELGQRDFLRVPIRGKRRCNASKSPGELNSWSWSTSFTLWFSYNAGGFPTNNTEKNIDECYLDDGLNTESPD